MQKKLGDRYIAVDPGPPGDVEIIKRTAVLKEADIPSRTSANVYFTSGYLTMLQWLKMADGQGLDLRRSDAILEFGCGSARLIRHLRCVAGARLVGCDLQSDFVAWCRQNIPGVGFFHNEFEPPLEFARSDAFDFVFAHSVFTHIPLAAQDAWIAELRRILKPGGLCMVSVLGEQHRQAMLSPEQRSQLRQRGHLTLGADHDQASYSTKLIQSWDVFQTREEVRGAFTAHFDLLDLISSAIDILVLRKPYYISGE